MPQGNPKPGEFYLDLKEKLYQIITIAEHLETGEILVIYQALYGKFQIYACPLKKFIDLVDSKEYPDIKQTYQFQLVGTENNDMVLKSQEQVEFAMKNKTSEEKMMAFFDADTMEEKYKILLDMRDDITDLMINNMAVVLDIVIEEGPLDQRYEELKTCVRTFQKYEIDRFR